MGFNCGIVGLPNVGKSTLFNALTKAGIDAENFPFCTIEPNTGVVPVPDLRLDALAGIVSPEKVIPTTMEFVDIAGLVAGASQGEGLGNQFLANIRETDAIAHVVRCFEDENVIHVDGRIDPISDIEIIETELLLADVDTVEKALARVSRAAKVGDKAAKAEADLLESVRAALEAGRAARTVLADASDELAARVRQLFLLTAKPIMYIANVAEDGFEDNPHLEAVQARAAEEGPLSCPSATSSSRRSPSWRMTRKSSSSPRWVSKSRVLIASFEPATACWTCSPSSLPVRRKRAPGPYATARPRRKVQGESTRTSRRALFAPRSLRTKTTSSTAVNQERRTPANGVWRARITSCTTATSCTSASMSERHHLTVR